VEESTRRGTKIVAREISPWTASLGSDPPGPARADVLAAKVTPKFGSQLEPNAEAAVEGGGAKVARTPPRSREKGSLEVACTVEC